MNDNQWHYEQNGKQVGPFEKTVLEQLRRANIICDETMLIHPDGSRCRVDEAFPSDPHPIESSTDASDLPTIGEVVNQELVDGASPMASDDDGQVSSPRHGLCPESTQSSIEAAFRHHDVAQEGNTSERWHIKLDNETIGPLTFDELRDLLEQGALPPTTPVSPNGEMWTTVENAPRLCPTKPTPVPNVTKPPSKSSPPLGFAQNLMGCVGSLMSWIAGSTFVLILLFRIAFHFMRPNEKQSPPPVAPPPVIVEEVPVDEPFDISPITTKSAEINLRWQDATSELQSFVQQMSPAQQAALGLTTIATGMDIYAARVTVRNNGTIPLRISPQNLRIHFGNETAIVYTFDGYRFLQSKRLQPGESMSGLVTYTARIDIGAAIRIGNGRMSYEDRTINVTYD